MDMADLQTQLEQLRQAMVVLQAQRATLGAAVDPVLAGLRQQLAALEAQLPAAPAPPEERRVITVLFTDIVGSTALAEQLDPEEWRQTVAAVHAAVGRVIEQHYGMVAQYLGDGLLAWFGVPQPGEYDPEHAVRAALGAQSAILSLGAGPPIELRVGIHTGLVVVGELGSEAKKELTATGDVMNLAARLQAAAPPGGVLISRETYRYVRGLFTVTPQPPLAVKGKGEPLQTYLVRRAKPRPFRAVTRGVAGVQTRTVGRDVELQRLQDAYLEARDHGSVIWTQVIGEAGVGKTRVVEEMREWLDQRPELIRLLRARAYAGDEAQPFALIRRMWFDRFQIAEDAPLAQAEAKWVQQFQELGAITEVEPAQALGLLVGLPFADSPHIGAMRADPEQVKGRAFVVSGNLLKAIRKETSIQILLEDLQWADASSWEYVREVLLADSAAADGAQGVFILGTGRPEWTPPDAVFRYGQYRSIDLQPLSDDATRELVRELLQQVEGVSDEVVRLLVERSEGIPYYAEEMVNWFIDRGIIDQSREPWRFVPSRLKESPLPATLQHLLLTRLSGLSEGERAVLQRGSIFGRNFWAGGLEALGVNDADRALRSLQARGFVDAEPESSFEGETEWSFHHTLLRDVTYESVLRRERATLHKAAAAWLERQAGRAGRLEEFAGLIGEHVERAGETSAAVEWYLQAGERARAQGALREARQFFSRALVLLPPIDRERRWRGLLGREEVLGILGEPEEQRTDQAALLELAKEFDDDDRLAEVYRRQAAFLRAAGDYRATLRAVDEAVTAARRAGNLLIEARALGEKTFAQTRLGEMSAARVSAEEALARAEESKDERTLAFTLSRVGVYYAESDDPARAAQLRLQQVAIDHRLGDRDQEARGLMNLGLTYLFLGLHKLARTALEQSLRLADSVGSRRGRAYSLQNLGLVYWRSGDNRTARRVLEQSLSEMTIIGDVFGRAGSVEYLGLAMEQAGDVAGAEKRFAEAKDVLTELGAAGVVNDALAGLARCALAQGHLDEARRYTAELWNALATGRAKGEFPLLSYQTCADLFDALGEGEQARVAVEAGHRELMARAEKISDPEWRKAFLGDVPEHRTIVEMRETIAHHA
jgi:class 3 adenylate cyclase/predicted ATPase